MTRNLCHTTALVLLIVAAAQAVNVGFTELDYSGQEGGTLTASVQVTDFSTGDDFSFTVRALSRDEFLALPVVNGIRSICDSVRADADFAEASDFDFTAETFVLTGDNFTNNDRGEFDVSVRLLDDSTFEENAETIVIVLEVIQSTTALNIGFQCATAIIAVDPSDAISVNVTGSRSVIDENEGMVSDAVIVSLHGEAEQELTLQVTYLGAAQIGMDYIAESTFVVQPSDTEISIPIEIIDDDIPEEMIENIVVRIEILGVSNTDEVMITILDNDVLSAGFDNETSLEVEEGGSLMLCVAVFSPTGVTITRNDLYTIETVSGTAQAGRDYVPTTINLVKVPKGCFTVQTIDDNLQEDSRSFTVTLSNLIATNTLTELEPNRVTITIMDNDYPPDAPEITEIFSEDDKTLVIKWEARITEMQPVDRLEVIITVEERDDNKVTEKPETGDTEEPENGDLDNEDTIETIIEEVPGDSTSYDFTNFNPNKTYTIMVCAVNAVATNCSEPAAFELDTATERLVTAPPPTVTIVVIVVVVVFFLLLCFLCCLILCICCVREREIAKNYYPEKTEKKYREKFDEYRSNSDEDSEGSDIV